MTSKKIDDNEIAKRIKGYLSRPDINTYDLMKEGRYEIISGTQGDYSVRETMGVVEGRYIDALVYAVQQGRFCGDWCTWDNPFDRNHGMIKRVEDNPIRDMEKGNKIFMMLRKK